MASHPTVAEDARLPILRTCLLLAALSLAGLLVAGYHPAAEDGGIYMAAIEHNLTPSLFHADSSFLTVKLQATEYDKCIAGIVRATHIPLEPLLFGLHLLTIFAFLAACYRIACSCFAQECARWSGVTLVALFFTLPITATGLYIVDQNLVPRTIASALVLFAVDFVLRRRLGWAAAFLLLTIPVHPVIAAFGISLCFFLTVPWRKPTSGLRGMALLLLPFGWLLHSIPTPAALHNAISMHHYCSLAEWTWYEWLGVIAPIGLLLWYSHLARQERPGSVNIQRLATRTAIYSTFQLAVAMAVMLPPALERLRPTEPMRYLHLHYVVSILLGGCFLGERLLQRKPWRWAVAFIPVALGMFLAQRALYPATPHLELPGLRASNPWVQTFEWVRTNTPQDAYFALGAEYLHEDGEDGQGFRAIAQRSALADQFKDSGMVLTSPVLAERWQREVAAQKAVRGGWQHVTAQDLRTLKAQFGVDWAIVENPIALPCPYHNGKLAVCRID